MFTKKVGARVTSFIWRICYRNHKPLWENNTFDDHDSKRRVLYSYRLLIEWKRKTFHVFFGKRNSSIYVIDFRFFVCYIRATNQMTDNGIACHRIREKKKKTTLKVVWRMYIVAAAYRRWKNFRVFRVLKTVLRTTRKVYVSPNILYIYI